MIYKNLPHFGAQPTAVSKDCASVGNTDFQTPNADFEVRAETEEEGFEPP
jgi:hypothetical protein